MTAIDRINRRLAKEEAERAAQEAEAAPKREERYKKIAALTAEYDELMRRAPRWTYPDEAKRIANHILDEYGHDLWWFFKRVRAGKEP